jgi:hypothetical protein
MFGDVITDLEQNGDASEPTIVFCRSFAAVQFVYRYFERELFDRKLLYAGDGQPVDKNRRIAMYHSVTDEQVKVEVTTRINKPIKILIATSAFGT